MGVRMCLLCALWMMLTGVQPQWIRHLAAENSPSDGGIVLDASDVPGGVTGRELPNDHQVPISVRPSRSTKLRALRTLLLRSYLNSRTLPASASAEREEDVFARDYDIPPPVPSASAESEREEEDEDEDDSRRRTGVGRMEEEEPQYDYRTPSADDIIVHAVPDRKTLPVTTTGPPTSRSAAELFPKIVTTRAPTAAPKPQNPSPTAAPARRTTAPDAKTVLGTAYPVPSVKTTPGPSHQYDDDHHHHHHHQQQPSTSTSKPDPSTSAGSDFGALLQLGQTLGGETGKGGDGSTPPKRTDENFGAAVTGLGGSNPLSGGGSGGAAAGPGEAVCLQYSSVQHDVSCDGRRKRRDVMSTRHLTSLLQHYGGSASIPFTAATFREASSNFRNLMPLGLQHTDDHIHRSFTVRQIHHLLEKHYADKNLSTSNPVSQPRSANGSVLPKEAQPARRSLWMESEQEEDDEVLRKLMNEGIELPDEFLRQMIPVVHLHFNSTAPNMRNRRNINRANHNSDACRYSVECQHFDASECRGGQTHMVIDDNGCNTCRCRDTTNGYCQTTPQSGGEPNVHLCTQCQQTRYLGPNVFPSYIQEVVCLPGSSTPCLDIAHHGPQGSCQETHIPVSVLHRHPGRCMRITLTNGQSLLFDDWLLAQHLVRTGCQCTLDRRSPLAARPIG